jgi:hypothetical protein
VLEAVQQGLEAYRPFAELELREDDAAWDVFCSKVDEDFEAEFLMSELGNYVLVRTIERKR